MMNAKERVMCVLNHQEADRMPCFAANAAVTYDQMQIVQAFWPEGHENGEAMAKQALSAYTVLGFDAVRVPFCQTFEAEALGCRSKGTRSSVSPVTLGTLSCIVPRKVPVSSLRCCSMR